MNFSRSDFDTLNKATLSNRMNDSIDFSLYWFHAIAKNDARFFQSQQMHRHKFFELHFILDGSITYSIDGEKIPLKKGDYVLFAPNQWHKIDEYGSELIKCSAAFTVGEEALCSALISGCGTQKKICAKIENTLLFISSITDKQTPYYGVIVKNRLFEIIHSIAGDINPDRLQKKDTEMDVRVLKVKHFVKDNPHVFLSCEDMARYCNISVKQLNRLFLKHEGISLLAYLHKEKIGQAKALLAEEKISLREISEYLGFSSVYYFSRFFSNHEGITPGEYRSMLKN